ncbi:MAG TPA: hypothetical protein VIA62_02100 [Thermoanaerobaculia bacterium]|jgi:hypothetical protein|nr:hypothetical protein [Thermoanaerobaculia bacterium]
MDQEILVEDFQRVFRELSKQRGPVLLLMLLAPEISSERDWNVVVSAKGFDAMDRASAIRDVVRLLKRTLSDENWRRVLRVTVLKTDDEFVRALTRTHQTKGSVVNLYSANISGIDIPKAIILQSKVAA